MPNETPTPEEPAIVQELREWLADPLAGSSFTLWPKSAHPLVDHLDRLASGTGERDDYYELYCSLNTRHTKQFRQLAEVLSERDSLRSDLACVNEIVRQVTHWMGALLTRLGASVMFPGTDEKPQLPEGFMRDIESLVLREKPAEAELPPEPETPTTGIAGLLVAARADLATAKRELEEERRDHTVMETKLDETNGKLMAALEFARSQPVVPTGERPSDEELQRIGDEAERCKRWPSRDLFDAGVARGEAEAQRVQVAMARFLETLRASLISTIEERTGETEWWATELVDGCGLSSHASVLLESLQSAEPKAEPVCGTCGDERWVDRSDSERIGTHYPSGTMKPCPDCTGKQEQATTGPHQHAFTIACFTDGIGSPIVHALKCKCGAIQERYPRPSGSFVEAPNPFDPAVVAGVRVWEDDVHPHPMRCDRCGESNFVLVEQPELRDAAIRFLIRCATCGDHPGAGSLAFSIPAEPTDEVPPGKVVVRDLSSAEKEGATGEGKAEGPQDPLAFAEHIANQEGSAASIEIIGYLRAERDRRGGREVILKERTAGERRAYLQGFTLGIRKALEMGTERAINWVEAFDACPELLDPPDTSEQSPQPTAPKREDD